MFTCQLSRITRELIFNFFDAREVVRTSSELFANAQDWLEILWKSQALFWSRRKLFYNLGYLQKSSGIFGNLWRSSGNLRQSSEVVENLWRFSKLEEYLRFLDFKTSWNYWKIWCAQMHFVIYITSDHIVRQTRTLDYYLTSPRWMSSRFLSVMVHHKIFSDSYWFKFITWRDSFRPRKIPGWVILIREHFSFCKLLVFTWRH